MHVYMKKAGYYRVLTSHQHSVEKHKEGVEQTVVHSTHNSTKKNGW
jgi:hypothetical protein